MKKNLQLIVYVLICTMIITTGIYAGQKQHTHCSECKLAIKNDDTEINKFAGK